MSTPMIEHAPSAQREGLLLKARHFLKGAKEIGNGDFVVIKIGRVYDEWMMMLAFGGVIQDGLPHGVGRRVVVWHGLRS